MVKTVALYMRLSNEDKKDGESLSITSQRNLIKDYIKNSIELNTYEQIEFIDDGYSGSNFNRPAIRELLNRVEAFEIGCIIVKDISRFGRNNLEVLPYIEQIFPFNNIRFISINDKLDTFKIGTNYLYMDTSIKAIINNLYIKDLSIKRKSANRILAKRGLSKIKTMPFGYLKCDSEQNKYIIDRGAESIIKDIFKYAISGKKASEIARILNDNKIPTPLEYWRINNIKNGVVKKNKNNKNSWDNQNINRILRNEIYTGTYIAYKREFIEANTNKTIKNNYDDWIKIEDRFEAIIDKETFNYVQNNCIVKRNKYKKNSESSLFSKKIYCGHCLKTLKNTGRDKKTFRCLSKRYLGEKECFNGGIDKNFLEKTILECLKKEINKKEIEVDDRVVNRCFDFENKQTRLVEKLINGVISSNEFQRETEKIKVKNSFNRFSNKDIFFDEQLTDDSMNLIEKILVYDNNNIEVIFNDKKERGNKEKV